MSRVSQERLPDSVATTTLRRPLSKRQLKDIEKLRALGADGLGGGVEVHGVKIFFSRGDAFKAAHSAVAPHSAVALDGQRLPNGQQMHQQHQLQPANSRQRRATAYARVMVQLMRLVFRRWKLRRSALRAEKQQQKEQRDQQQFGSSVDGVASSGAVDAAEGVSGVQTTAVLGAQLAEAQAVAQALQRERDAMWAKCGEMSQALAYWQSQAAMRGQPGRPLLPATGGGETPTAMVVTAGSALASEECERASKRAHDLTPPRSTSGVAANSSAGEALTGTRDYAAAAKKAYSTPPRDPKRTRCLLPAVEAAAERERCALDEASLALAERSGGAGMAGTRARGEDDGGNDGGGSGSGSGGGV